MRQKRVWVWFIAAAMIGLLYFPSLWFRPRYSKRNRQLTLEWWRFSYIYLVELGGIVSGVHMENTREDLPTSSLVNCLWHLPCIDVLCYNYQLIASLYSQSE